MTSEAIRAIQRGLDALGYEPGPIDGLDGPRTRTAAQRFGDGLPARPVATTGLKRIVWHWTAGSHAPSAVDRRHYHFIIAGDGEVVPGEHRPEDNVSTADGRYAAHTRACNTGAIGVALAAMGRARERPFDPGRWPIRPQQVEALARLTSELCARYRIGIDRETTLSHAEVQPTLGIHQAGKWDIVWLPDMAAPGDPIAVGDVLRARVRALSESSKETSA